MISPELRTEPDYEIACTCEECFSDILDGELYYYLCGKVLCRGCVEDGERTAAKLRVWPARGGREAAEYGKDF